MVSFVAVCVLMANVDETAAFRVADELAGEYETNRIFMIALNLSYQF